MPYRKTLIEAPGFYWNIRLSLSVCIRDLAQNIVNLPYQGNKLLHNSTTTTTTTLMSGIY